MIPVAPAPVLDRGQAAPAEPPVLAPDGLSASPTAWSPGWPAAVSPAVPASTRPLSALPDGAWQDLAGVLTDIDDTLTRDGAIETVALEALHALDAAGVPVVCITGRPLGWCRERTGGWPVRAVVAENGAVALLRAPGGAVSTEYVQDAATRAHNARRLAAVAARIVAEVPGATLAQDSAGRETDIAIDHAEFARLDAVGIAQVVALMRAEGLVASVSSIHINGWFGTHDKASGADWMLARLFGQRLAEQAGRWVYVGDSTNDEALFGRLPHSVGVANLMRFAAELRHWPAWLAAGERGAGFAEVAEAVLRQRSGARA
jgi:HAD superfamily hydrolase (TIGR01484 family)